MLAPIFNTFWAAVVVVVVDALVVVVVDVLVVVVDV
jgi:hypothetical protein